MKKSDFYNRYFGSDTNIDPEIDPDVLENQLLNWRLTNIQDWSKEFREKEVRPKEKFVRTNVYIDIDEKEEVYVMDKFDGKKHVSMAEHALLLQQKNAREKLHIMELELARANAMLVFVIFTVLTLALVALGFFIINN